MNPAYWTTKRRLHTYDEIWRPYSFEHVIARATFFDHTCEDVPIPGIVFSEFECGPNLTDLADYVNRHRAGVQWVGLAQCHPLAWCEYRLPFTGRWEHNFDPLAVPQEA